jgi:hypothetical protein
MKIQGFFISVILFLHIAKWCQKRKFRAVIISVFPEEKLFSRRQLK